MRVCIGDAGAELKEMIEAWMSDFIAHHLDDMA